MKFPYKTYSKNILRPVIPIKIVHKGILVLYEVLIDSGADSNIFSSVIADILEIDLHKGEKGKIAGIGGKDKTIYFHYLDIRVSGILHESVRVGFMKEMGEFAYGVLGQNGFFDLYVVKFDILKKEIELYSRV